MRELFRLWSAHSLSLELKYRLYNCLVRPILIYNCGTWAGPHSIFDQLDTFHRKHLRRLAGIHYPRIISNKSLYQMFDTHPLSWDVRRYRWYFLGHALRLPRDTPAQLMLDSYMVAPSYLKGRRGKHQTSLISLLSTEFKAVTTRREYRQLGLQNMGQLNNMRSLANDRRRWTELSHDVCGKHNVFAATT